MPDNSAPRYRTPRELEVLRVLAAHDSYPLTHDELQDLTGYTKRAVRSLTDVLEAEGDITKLVPKMVGDIAVRGYTFRVVVS